MATAQPEVAEEEEEEVEFEHVDFVSCILESRGHPTGLEGKRAKRGCLLASS